ncbi:MAG: RNase P subunit p30 family protein [Candidatus Nanohaloarchaea archaeon]
MTDFHEICLRDTSKEMEEFSRELGWDSTNCRYETVFIEADDWGELKRKIGEKRSRCDVLVFEGGDEELNRKAAEDPRMDVLLHPERGRKDSGINHVVAEAAAENRVAIGFDLQQLLSGRKKQAHVLNHWRRNLKLCEKYDAPYIITSHAGEKLEMRAPRELKAILDSLGHDGKKAVSDFPADIIERAKKAKDGSVVRPGVELMGDTD